MKKGFIILSLSCYSIVSMAQGDVETTKSLTYNSDGLVASEAVTGSNGDVTTTYYRYPHDILNTTSYGTSFAQGLKKLQDINAVEKLIEKYTVVTHQGVADVVDAEAYEYMPSSPYIAKYYKLDNKMPLSSFQPAYITNSSSVVPQSPQYRLEEEYSYDNYGNITQVDYVGKKSAAYIYGYDNSLRIAEVDNAKSNEIAYTSFELGCGAGGWSYSGTGTVAVSPNKTKTGNRFYYLGTNSITKTGLPVKKYIVSFWFKVNNGGGPIMLPKVNGVYASNTVFTNSQGWMYNEEIVTGTSSVTIQGGMANTVIDEVRLHPFDATMKTYTHIPLIGISSETDGRGITNYYEYDDLNRLQLVLDNNYHILKKHEYKLQQAD